MLGLFHMSKSKKTPETVVHQRDKSPTPDTEEEFPTISAHEAREEKLKNLSPAMQALLSLSKRQLPMAPDEDDSDDSNGH